MNRGIFLISHRFISKKTGIGIITLICCALLLIPSSTAGLFDKKDTVFQHTTTNQDNGEYWGLIFAVGYYNGAPDQDRPSMIDAAHDLYEVLVESPEWQPDHIHMLTANQATGKNLIRELIWLIQNSKASDKVVIYLTTHGSPMRNSVGLPIDLPPRDEADGADEILVMYDGFIKDYAIIWDDLLNFFISRIKAEGICLIVDSCFSGGFNDDLFMTHSLSEYTASSFSQGMIEELSGERRIVLMSSQEDEYSYGSIFSFFLIEGFWGWADLFGNLDGKNSAEEAFDYAEPLTKLWTDYNQQPTIVDNYPGEFVITTN